MAFCRGGQKSALFRLLVLVLLLTILGLVGFNNGIFLKVLSTHGGDGLASEIKIPRFVPEMSSLDDHPDVKFMRQYGRIHGLPGDAELKNMTLKELLYIYHSYLDNTDYKCRRKLRMGKVGDGGWEVCDDIEFRPTKPCLIYSFGIQFDFSFDDEVGRLYGCHVYSFDPSMNVASHKRSPKVDFFKIGLGGESGELPIIGNQHSWIIKTLTAIKAMLGHANILCQQFRWTITAVFVIVGHKDNMSLRKLCWANTIDILKIDIEHSEWPALVSMMENGELKNVRQFLIEFHTEVTAKPLELAYRQRLHLLAEIEQLGFRRFYTHLNPLGQLRRDEYPDARTTAYEVYFVNTKLSRQQKSVQF